MAPRITRRRVLIGTGGAAATCVAAIAASAIIGPRIAEWVTDDSVDDSEHVNALAIPPVLEGDERDGIRQFELTLQEGSRSFIEGSSTPTWGVNGDFLGPTLRMRRSDVVQMSVSNSLPDATSIHWHGMHLPAEMDGGPHQMIDAGTTWTPTWTVDQPATTLWYHPHPHGETADHVWNGIAGMMILDDDTEVSLPHEYGVDDIPVIIQDRRFNDDGEFERREYAFGYFGNRIMVNGTIGARLDVTHSRMRFRILNGSNTRWYNLAFADDRRFQLIATDSGYVEDPAPELTSLLISPGERAEIVVSFQPGDDVMLQNRSATTWQLRDYGTEHDFDVIRFVATASLVEGDDTALPTTSRELPGADGTERSFTLNGHDSINDRTMDMSRIDDVVTADAVEIWDVSASNFATHNFHIHGVTFEVLDFDGEEPPVHQRGPKDTVQLPRGTTVRLLVPFPPFTDEHMPYMYHCHVLQHEDNGMMGQFVVVEPGREDEVDRTIAGAHAH